MKRLWPVLVALPFATPAHAWEARCEHADRSACTDADSATSRVRGVYPGEHGVLFSAVVLDQAYPAMLLEPFDLTSFTTGSAANGDPSLDTAVPEPDPELVLARLTRTVTLDTFSELPDFTYGLADYLSGNEICPIVNGPTDVNLCHLYAVDTGAYQVGYLGPLNSPHFVPQSGRMHAHYHALALEQATHCLEMAAAFDDFESAPEHQRRSVQDCDRLSLALEAMGQHYLQDTWSSGHMWHRWGAPDVDAVGGNLNGAVVAAISGLIHGAESLLHSPDPLCFPTEHVRWVLNGGPPQAGVGDLYVTDLLSTATYTSERTMLFACAAGFLHEVYLAGAQSLGPAPPAPAATDSADCYAPRITNEGFVEGFAIRVGWVNVPLDLAVVAGLEIVVAGVDAAIWAALPDAAALVSVALFESSVEIITAELRADLVSIGIKARLANLVDPNGTDVGTNTGLFGMGNLLGVQPNDAYLGLVPAPQHDPDFPGELDQPYKQVFRGAFVQAWCEEITLNLVSGLAARCHDEPDDGEVGHFGDDREHGACALCEVMADAVFRDGCSAEDVHEENDGVCHVVADDLAAVEALYLPLDEESREDRIEVFCHGSPPPRTCDRLAIVDRRNNRLLGFQGDVGLLPDFAIPVGTTPQRLAVTRGQPQRALVANGTEGSVSLIDLGNEHELDWDADAETTDFGAPAGITRIPISGPRGIALTLDDRFAFVASDSTNVLTVIDVLGRRIRALIPLAAAHADSVTLDGTGTKAYVTLAGTIAAPDNRIAIVDVATAIDDEIGNEVVRLLEHVGGNSRPTRMALSPDGTTIAFVMAGTSMLGTLDTTTDTVVDLFPDEPPLRFIQLDYPPTGVAWAPDGLTLYALEVSSDGGAFGALRREGGPPRHRLGDPIMVGAGPRAVATSPDGQRAYVGNGDNTLTFVDLGVGGVFGVLDLGAVWLDSVSPSDLAAY